MTSISKLLGIMRSLREPETGCPWDIEQTFETIAPYTIEEAYEVADAIERKDLDDLKKELGDLLFQVVYHAQMANEKKLFDFDDVVEAISEKLIRRHPHVFADVSIENKEELYQAWEEHKKNERKEKGEHSTLDGIASMMPALRWSEKLQKRAAHVGFDWDNVSPVLDKIDEEIQELKHEIQNTSEKERLQDELGDVLFSCVNLARHLDVNAEEALRQSNRKFIQRFKLVETLVSDAGKKMESCSIEELENFWQEAKAIIALAAA